MPFTNLIELFFLFFGSLASLFFLLSLSPLSWQPGALHWALWVRAAPARDPALTWRCKTLRKPWFSSVYCLWEIRFRWAQGQAGVGVGAPLQPSVNMVKDWEGGGYTSSLAERGGDQAGDPQTHRQAGWKGLCK